MRLTTIKASKSKPIELFEVSDLSEVVVLAGPNGVGKSRLIASILQHFQNSQSIKNVSLGIEATDPSEEKAWGKKFLNTSDNADCQKLHAFLAQNRNRRNLRSSVVNFESDRSIQQIQPFNFTWDIVDPWEEKQGWNFMFGGLRNRFQDTLHAIFRKVKSLENEIASQARELMRSGKTSMDLNFKDPLEAFKEIFFQLLAPKVLLDADVRNQRLTYSYEGQTFGVESLSSGEREVLNISFDFLLRSPSHCIVFFDEPELHLHPELSYRLLTTLRSIGTRNQFILCTHSPDIISAALDQTVVFVAPQKSGAAINQAIVVKEDDETNQALRLLGHSIGIVALGKKIVLVEGTNASLDKQTYGSLLKAKFPSLVLVPTGGKQTIQSFSSVVSSVLDKSLWGVEFFMLCDGDTTPLGTEDGEIEKKAKGRLRSLPQYHLENYFLDENVLAKIFENMEPPDSWLRSPEKISAELRSIAKTLVSYTVALAVSRTFRLAVGNVDIMPKQCHGATIEDLSRLLQDAVSKEKGRVLDSLDDKRVTDAVTRIYAELNDLLNANDNRWKARIPGKPLLAQFAAKAKIDSVRLKTLYLHHAAEHSPNPFQDIFDIFSSFNSLGRAS